MSSILKALLHPDELAGMVYFKFIGQKKIFPPNDVSELRPTMQRCYYFLDKTSRSFSAVIQALDPELRSAICLFYLILRGLDTVEDDMTIPVNIKTPLLQQFYNKLEERGWSFDGNSPTEKDRQLLVEFAVVIDEFQNLRPAYRTVISDITRRMGHGMAEFQNRSVETIKDYDLYCHYVAGLVGIGLSKLFAASQLEDMQVGVDEELANSMGLFLQKTNIIRDYLEDLQQNRTWYPKEVWGKYHSTLDGLAEPANKAKALACLNDMVTNALRHVPDVFTYLGRIRNQSVFNFCAIPQVMAIATLSLCYNNYGVFTGVVKIRKGEAVQLIMSATSMQNIYETFDQHLRVMREKVCETDPSYKLTVAHLDHADSLLQQAVAAGAYVRPVATKADSAVRALVTVGVLASIAYGVHAFYKSA